MSETSFDKGLVGYQKLCLFLLYPPLISFVSAALGVFSDNYRYLLCLSVQRTFSLYLSNAFPSSLGYRFLGLLPGLLLTAFSIYLSLMAAKGKIWALVAAGILYLADGVYNIALLFPSLSYAYALPEGLLPLFIHILFLVVFVICGVKYAKLCARPRKGGN